MAFIASFDREILAFYHSLAEKNGDFFTPVAKFFSFIGEKGLWMIILAVVLMCFAKTRKTGVCLFGAVGCGALITNFILKDLVGRARPFMNELSEFRDWWLSVGSPQEDEFSFPSGHATAAAAGILALALIWNYRVLWAGIPYAAIMCASRNYLMVHYPTDVVCGVAVGVVSAFIAFGITKLIYNILEKYSEKAFCRWILQDFDLILIAKKIKQKYNDRRTDK